MHFIKRQVEQAASQLLSRGAREIIIELGARSVYHATASDRAFFIPARKVTAIDTVAARDSFNGALAAALVEERTIGKRFAGESWQPASQ